MSILSDSEILAEMAAGRLVRGRDKARVGPACYELRAGGTYYDLTESDKPIEARKFGNILVKPGHRVVFITQEVLVVPNGILARISSKGSLFSIGLSPVSTYADPGFSGNVGIVTHNISDRYIQIPIGEPIAKVDFSHLSRDAASPYVGQHGFQTQIWPIKHQLQKAYSDIANDPRVAGEELEANMILPPATAVALGALQKRQRELAVALLLIVLFNSIVLFFVVKNPSNAAEGLLINLLSNAVIAITVWLFRLRG